MNPLKIKFLIPLILLLQSNQFLFTKDIKSDNRDITIPGIVVAKIKPGIHVIDITNYFSNSVQPISVLKIEKAFPHNENSLSLSRIVNIYFSSNTRPEEYAATLARQEIFEYVEPKYMSSVDGITPNDSLIESQFHLAQTNMFAAWEVERGSPDMIIAVVDNGTDYRHPDLIANIWTNQAESQGISGIDDDGNGYVDDIHGWDFGENDNDPTYGTSKAGLTVHGTHTAGIASAVTNNVTGIAGVGWNCTIMPIKVSTDDDAYHIPFGYEGIVYAADNGAHVINNSWGRGGFYSQYEQDIINYAVSKGCIIVAAAGNANQKTMHYPAGYIHVIAVAAVNRNDEKASYSNYSQFIDLSAPGGDHSIGEPGIFSTYPTEWGEYGELSGTSMASPIVTGIMGLLLNKFSTFRLHQLTRQVVLTADNIDDLNLEYQGLIGYGRANGLRALTEDVQEEELAKIDLFKIAVYDSIWGNGNFLFERNETIGVDVCYRNYAVSPGRNIVITLSTDDPDLLITKKRATIDYFPPDTILAIRKQLNFRIKLRAKPHLTKLFSSYSLDNGFGGSDTLVSIIGKSSVLLVDDDNGIRNVEDFYTNILDKLGISYLRWDRSQLGTPPPKTIIYFPMIIWFCEWAFPSLTPEDRIALQYYLNQNGSLFISGQDIGWDLADPTGIKNNQYSESAVQFYQEYLHTIYRVDHSGSQTVIGVPGTIGQGMQFNIYQPKIASNFQFPEWIEPTWDANLSFQYDNGKGAGVSYSGTNQVLNLGFGFEAVAAKQDEDLNHLSPVRLELMQRILNKLGPIRHQPIPDQNQGSDSLSFFVELSSLVDDLQSLYLFWKTEDVADYSRLNMYSKGNRIFQQTVKLDSYTGKVCYFFKLSTPYFQFSLPINPQNKPFSFHIGLDRSAPTFFHIPLKDVFIQKQCRTIKVYVEDNFAVDTNSVWLHYKTVNKADSMLMISIRDDWYQSSIPAIAPPGNSMNYYFSANDLATITNHSTSQLFSYKVGVEGFEYGIDYWIPDSDSWDLDDHEFHSGRYSISSFPGQTYKENINISLKSKFGLRRKDLKEAELLFWTKHELEEMKDFGFVEISLDNGRNWENIGEVITGVQENWIKKNYDLTSFYIETEITLSLRFRMQTDSDQAQPMAGWFIDDIAIQTKNSLSIFEKEKMNPLNKPHVEIYSNSPNPFNGLTKIYYHLSVSGEITLEIYNLRGQLVTKQLLGWQLAGLHNIFWDGKDQNGQYCGSGVYFGRLIVQNSGSNIVSLASKTIKMIYLE